MNQILKQCIESRNGNYCHVLEVADVYELQNIVESIADEGWNKTDLIDFFQSAEVYCMVESNEDSVYNFSFEEYINNELI
ncbi:MAG: hypothetical protein Unbinned4388contig1000_70 [Prokaryotic dsDNA virus sp.]|nr:MAG: hypothetical protein Unbinned4388contig1000_70 [Prokaryotic dsDNA virus sp.]|tara:strand:- start:2011 stop:2250 length:240 start_codon:yes stop_codon:yes gene_type:complete